MEATDNWWIPLQKGPANVDSESASKFNTLSQSIGLDCVCLTTTNVLQDNLSRSVDSEVHVIHISCVIITYTGLMLDILKMDTWMHMGRTANIII